MGLSAVRAGSRPADDSIRDRLQRSVDTDPPHFRFVEAALGFGAVNFAKDIDGRYGGFPF